MKRLLTLFFLFAPLAAAQNTFCPQNLNCAYTGNNTHSGTEAFSSINNRIFADQQAGATADVKITNAIAALPSAGGTIDASGFGAGIQTIAATVNVGTTSKTVTLLLDRSTNFQCTITGGTPCWNFAEGSTAMFIGEVPSSSTNGGFSVSNSANISNVILMNTGATGNFVFEPLQILGNSSATVSDSVVKIINGSGKVRGLTIGGFTSTVLLKVTQTAAQFVGPITFDNLQINCGAVSGCKPVLVQAVASGGVMLGLNFIGGSLSHPGSGGLAILDLEGITGNDCSGVDIYGMQFESSNTTDIGIKVNNCSAVRIHDPSFTAAAAIGSTCLQISGGNTNGVEMFGLNNFSSWTNNVVNNVNSRTITNANNKMKYYGFGFTGATTANDFVYDNAAGNISVLDNNGLSTTKLVNNTGIQLFTTSATCSTSGVIDNACTTGAITLPVGYSDTNYRLSCTGQGPTALPVVETYTKSNTTFTITIVALTAAVSTFSSYDCSAWHN